METLKEIRYVDFSTESFALAQTLRQVVGEDAATDGKSRWILPQPPLKVAAEYGEGFTMSMSVSFTSDDPTTEISWTAAGAYITALCQGAAEKIRRSARREDRRRFVALGSKADAEATLMGMRIVVEVEVL
jgi:hypothetical protein